MQSRGRSQFASGTCESYRGVHPFVTFHPVRGPARRQPWRSRNRAPKHSRSCLPARGTNAPGVAGLYPDALLLWP
jgi:hypothetical protein